MKELFLSLLIWVSTVTGIPFVDVPQEPFVGAPTSNVTIDLIPATNDRHYIGTTTPSTLEYLGIFTKDITISGTCTGCPAGAGGTGSNWLYVADTLDFLTPSTTVGVLISASTTINSMLHVTDNLSASTSASVATLSVTDLTSGDIIIGGGVSPLTALDINANGTLLIGDGSGAPTVATLTAGVDIDITNGAGSITITNGRDFDWFNFGTYIIPTTTAGLLVNASSTFTTQLNAEQLMVGGDAFGSAAITARASTTGVIPLYLVGTDVGLQDVSLFDVATSTDGLNTFGQVFTISDTGSLAVNSPGAVEINQFNTGSFALESAFALSGTGASLGFADTHFFTVLANGTYDFNSTEDLTLDLTGTNIASLTTDTGVATLQLSVMGLLAQASSTVVGNFTVDGQATTTGDFSVGGVLDTSIISCTEALETNAIGQVVCGTDAGGGVPDWFMIAGDTAIRPTTTVGILINASSTIDADLHVRGNLAASSTLTVGANSLLSANVGIGTSTPYGLLSLDAPTGDAPYFVIGSSTEVLQVSQSATAVLGVGTSSPWRMLSVAGTAAISGLTSATGGTNNDVCIVSATKEIVEETTGVCVVSMRSSKHDIFDLTVGLETLLDLRPISYSPNQNEESDYKDTIYGFVAEDLQESDPHLARYGIDGKARTIDDWAILAVVVKSIQDFYSHFQSLVVRVSGLEHKLEQQNAKIEELERRLNELQKWE